MADWTCGKCVAATTEEQPLPAEEEVTDSAIAYKLHLALNCSSRSDGGWLKASDIQHEDTLDGMLQMQRVGQPMTKRQKRSFMH